MKPESADNILIAVVITLALAVASVLVPAFANAIYVFWTELAPESKLWAAVFGS